MNLKQLLLLGILAVSSLHAAPPTVTPEAMRSPVNKVFQFTQSGDFTGWADGSKTSARSYLWIPEECKKLKGLVILCANVPEQMLAGHEAMRKACAENDLGIVWCPGSLYNFKKSAIKKSSLPLPFWKQVIAIGLCYVAIMSPGRTI